MERGTVSNPAARDRLDRIAKDWGTWIMSSGTSNNKFHLVELAVTYDGRRVGLCARHRGCDVRMTSRWGTWDDAGPSSCCNHVLLVADLVREAVWQELPVVQIAMQYGMILFIASEVMFVAFFWAFFDFALYPRRGVWPPEGVETFNPFDLPLMNTLVLLLSARPLPGAAALIENNRKT